MVAKDYQKTQGSAKVEVGEIDTSAPFQSVKDAVSLFGEGAFSGEKPAIKKPKSHSADRVLAKETRLHLVQKEFNKLKEQLENAETTKTQALLELEKANRTVSDLTQKLKTVNESKDSAIRDAKAANHQAKQFAEFNNGRIDGSSNMDMETARVQYTAIVTELDAAKQELRNIRQEYDSFIDAKHISEKQLAESDNSCKENMGKIDELSTAISTFHDSIQQVNLAQMEAKEEETKIRAEKDEKKRIYKAKLEESVKKLLVLKKSVDHELANNLETRLSETFTEIESIKNETEKTRTADRDYVKTITSELDGAKESLQKVAEEENLLKNLAETLKLELENIKKEHSELIEKDTETESIAGNLHVKLCKAKLELEEALVEEAKARGSSDEMIATIHKLALERENAKREVEEAKQQAEELKRVAEATRIDLEKTEIRLEIAIIEAEEAKAAEARALDQIKILSDKTNASRASFSEPGSQITVSRDEFDSLSRKVQESENLAELKVSAAMAQVEAVKASENEALKRLEATQKEIEDVKAATQEALKKAEMAEAAKKAVEGELRRWREREQKKAAEAASRILAETEKSFELPSPRNYQIEKQKPLEKKVNETRKLEKAKTSVAKKKILMPSLSGMFLKKKNQVEGGSPSYLPSEKPVW